MNERITLVSLFDEEEIAKIKSFVSDLEMPLCKVPYGKNVDDRFTADTLPYHFTLCSWSITKYDEVVEVLKSMEFSPFKVLVKSVNVIEGNENSLEVRFQLEKNDSLYQLQSFLFERVRNSYYNPDTFTFHITIHCDQNREKIIKMKERLAEKFVPFELEVKRFGLFEIYPANFVCEVSCIQ